MSKQTVGAKLNAALAVADGGPVGPLRAVLRSHEAALARNMSLVVASMTGQTPVNALGLLSRFAIDHWDRMPTQSLYDEASEDKYSPDQKTRFRLSMDVLDRAEQDSFLVGETSFTKDEMRKLGRIMSLRTTNSGVWREKAGIYMRYLNNKTAHVHTT